MKLETEVVQYAWQGRPQREVVRVDGREVGTIEHYPNTRATAHPWKAYLGILLRRDDPSAVPG